MLALNKTQAEAMAKGKVNFGFGEDGSPQHFPSLNKKSSQASRAFPVAMSQSIDAARFQYNRQS